MARRDYNFTDGRELTIGTMFCIGRNYSAHAKEMGGEPATDPVVFLKPPQAYLPDGSSLKLPDFSENVHHELELVVVIGRDCSNIGREEAASYIAGFGVGIDFTLRDIQAKAKEKGHPWAVAKGFTGAAPISKIVPFEEIGSADHEFELELKINGEPGQRGNTRDMERQVSVLIEYLSIVFTLRAGDCIFTGTPEGVGQVRSGDHLAAELKGYTELKIDID